MFPFIGARNLDMRERFFAAVRGDDEIAFSSTEVGAWIPGNINLVGGTGVLQGFYFQSPGTWTITATNVTNGATISSGTSIPITVTNP